MKDISINIGQKSSMPTLDKRGDSSQKTTGAQSFAETLKGSIQEANNLQIDADRAIQKLGTGETRNIHETMILLEKADISFRLMMEVRNKLMEAYREIMRTQV
jgi:flagellar hook-basal body complex protein FliE